MNGEGELSLAVLSSAFPGPTQPRRGAFIERLHGLLAQEFRTTVVTPRVFAGDPIEEMRGGLDVRRARYCSGGRPPRDGRISVRMLLSFVVGLWFAARRAWPRNGRVPTVVIGHWIVPVGWLAAGVARRIHRPLVLCAHGSDLHRYGSSGVGQRLARKALRAAQHVVAVSDELAARVRSIAGCDVPLSVIPMGVEEHFLRDPHRDGGGEADDRPAVLRVLFVGDLIEQKGVAVIAGAASRLAASGVRVSWRIVGEGSLRTSLEGVPSVSLSGVLSSSGVREEMDAAHVLVLPSRSEGSPLVVQEAICRNLPVLAPAVGGIPGLFRSRRGWIERECRLPEALAGAIAGLAAEGSDGWRHRRIAMEANERESLSETVCGRRWSALLRRVASCA